MEQLRILAMVGGISKNSINKKLFVAMKHHAPLGVKLEYFDISELPFFSQDIEHEPPRKVKEFKELITQSDAVLFITPEYNRSIPGVLKNAIDWASRPYGENLWDKLPAGVMGCSVGNTGTLGSQQHLRQVLGYLNMAVMGQPEFYLNASHVFDEHGTLVDTKTKEHIEKYWDSFVHWINFVAPEQEAFRAMPEDDSTQSSLNH